MFIQRQRPETDRHAPEWVIVFTGICTILANTRGSATRASSRSSPGSLLDALRQERRRTDH